MKHPSPDLYIIDKNGDEQKIEFSKLRLDFQNGNKVTIEIGEHKPDSKPEIVLRGYYGNEEYKPADKYIVLNMRSGGCNLICIQPEAHLSGSLICKS